MALEAEVRVAKVLAEGWVRWEWGWDEWCCHSLAREAGRALWGC